MNGKQLWKKDLGVLDAGYFRAPEAQWETGSSPVIHDNVVLVQADVQKGSFLAAFDRAPEAGLFMPEQAPKCGLPVLAASKL